jgi:hypothetical protein
MTMKKPQWRDAKAVADWIIETRRGSLLGEMGLEESPGGFYQMGGLTVEVGDEIYSVLEPDPEPSEEEQAIEAAMRGNTDKLVDLIKAERLELEATPDHALKLTPATLRLVEEFISGKRNLKTGKEKGKPGRAKMSRDERANRTPTHNAAKYYVPAAERVLRREYPGLTDRDYRDRALYIAGLMSGRKDTTLAKYRNRPIDGPHRI